MANKWNLKTIERKAYRSTFQDGLIDMQYGLIVICMSFMLYRPETGYTAFNTLLPLIAILLIRSLFRAAKNHVTLPRMGLVKFGEMRAIKKKTKAIALTVVVLFQILLLVVTFMGWLNPLMGAKINTIFNTINQIDLVVAGIGGMIVGISMMLVAIFEDFIRGFYIAILMSVAVFIMIALNKPLIPILIGLVIFTPGLILFLKFIKKYQIPESDINHE